MSDNEAGLANKTTEQPDRRYHRYPDGVTFYGFNPQNFQVLFSAILQTNGFGVRVEQDFSNTYGINRNYCIAYTPDGYEIAEDLVKRAAPDSSPQK